MDEKALGGKLQLARRRAGLTQQELCQKAGLSYSTLAKIERGAIKSPSVFTVAAIASATGTHIEDLLDLGSLTGASIANPKKRSKSGVTFVYFDLNGVLVRFFHRAFAAISRDTHKSADTVETFFWRYNAAVCKGDMSLDELNQAFAKELGLPEFDWPKYYLENTETMPGMIELVNWTAQNYEVGIISESMPGLIESLKDKGIIPNIQYKAIVDSSKVGILKSEPRIYELAQQLASVEPREILMIDDTRTNLILADKLGWQVSFFNDFHPEESIEHIKQNLAF